MVHVAMKIAAALLLFTSATTASNNGEEARWLVQTALWGTLSWLEEGKVSSTVASYGEADGRIFYYLPINMEFRGSLTLSEAMVDSSQFDGARCGPDGNLDPEDPRCAKLTVSGTMTPCNDDAKQFGLDTLFASHPQMEAWPADHGFTVYEMEIEQLWMIANFGGGGYLDTDDFLTANPVHHPTKGFPTRTRRRTIELEKRDLDVGGRPNFGDDAAGHARWLVAKSLWTTISTVSTTDTGNAFGNIRSVADGRCFLNSSGTPYFYLPSPDPTAIDIEENDQIVLSFSEAALPQLVGEDGVVCGGMDAEDPTCAKIAVSGRAVPLSEEEIVLAEGSFAAQHPNAKWLSQGGAHTGGTYYTIAIESFEFFRSYGGLAELSVDDYTNWTPDASKFDGEEQCDTTDEPVRVVVPSTGKEGCYQGGVCNGAHGCCDCSLTTAEDCASASGNFLDTGCESICQYPAESHMGHGNGMGGGHGHVGDAQGLVNSLGEGHDHGVGMGDAHGHDAHGFGNGMGDAHGHGNGMGDAHGHGGGMGDAHGNGAGMGEGHGHGAGMGDANGLGKGMGNGNGHGGGMGGAHGNGDGMGEEHGHGDGMGEGHGHGDGMGWEKHQEQQKHNEEFETKLEDELCDEFSWRSFVYGNVVGFVLWGPVLALILYHRMCGNGNGKRRSKADDAEFVPVVTGISA